MRCLFKHKWIVGGVFDVRFFSPWKICTRCGRMQRGTSEFSTYIAWETMRERNYITSEQIQIIRQPSSRLDQLAHSLGLRRSRMGDGTRPERRSEQTRS